MQGLPRRECSQQVLLQVRDSVSRAGRAQEALAGSASCGRPRARARGPSATHDLGPPPAPDAAAAAARVVVREELDEDALQDARLHAREALRPSRRVEVVGDVGHRREEKDELRRRRARSARQHDEHEERKVRSKRGREARAHLLQLGEDVRQALVLERRDVVDEPPHVPREVKQAGVAHLSKVAVGQVGLRAGRKTKSEGLQYQREGPSGASERARERTWRIMAQWPSAPRYT